MKIVDVKAIFLRVPLQPSQPKSPHAETSGQHTLVQIITDEGITGLGEAFRLAPPAMCALIEGELKPLLLGQDPLHLERLWEVMYNHTFRYGRKGLALHAISALEIALWDIAGKFYGVPLYQMLGGLCRDKVKAYASLLPFASAEDVAQVSRWCVQQGYSDIKLHQRDMASIKAARQAVGEGIPIMVDVNGAWDVRESIKKAHEMAEYGVLWLEEPVAPMDDYDGLAEVRRHSPIWIASGENEYTHYGFKEMILKGAVDVLQPDAIKAGGILACRKVFALAEAWNLKIAPHCYCYGPGVAATVHLALSSPRCMYVEINPQPLVAEFTKPWLRPQNGYLTPPPGPGLGIELDEDVVKEYRQGGEWGRG